MKFNNIESFLAAIEDRMDQLGGDETSITSSTSLGSGFTEDEYEKFGSIVDEARALCDNEEDIVDWISNRLGDLGYSDDEITTVLDYEGL